MRNRKSKSHADLRARLAGLMVKALNKRPYEPDLSQATLEEPYTIVDAARDILTKHPNLLAEVMDIDDIEVHPGGLYFPPMSPTPVNLKLQIGISTVIKLVEENPEISEIQRRRSDLQSRLLRPAPPASLPMPPAGPSATGSATT